MGDVERESGVVETGADSEKCRKAEDADEGTLGLPTGDPWAEVGVLEEEEVGVATG